MGDMSANQETSEFPFEILDSGLIYRNPKPFLRSIQAYFPSVVSLGDGELVASIVLGEAFEALNSRVYLTRSLDWGKTWQLEGRITKLAGSAPFSEYGRITALNKRELVAWIFRHTRVDPEMGLTNPENMGFVETHMLIYRSADLGRHWTGPQVLTPPLEGPAFEICSPIIPLSDGRWLAPTSTWRGWNGECPNGMKALCLISDDRGETWPDYFNVMDGSYQDIIFWEQKTIELEDGRLISVAWTYDEQQDADLENHYALSQDGRTFSAPAATGLQGQTPAISYLGGDRLLVVYRRTDRPGLWANIASLDGDRWSNLSEICLWGPSRVQNTAQKSTMVEAFHQLRFGAPCITALGNGELLIAFWCVEDCVANIRYIRLGEI
jgi:hypothetical protein